MRRVAGRRRRRGAGAIESAAGGSIGFLSSPALTCLFAVMLFSALTAPTGADDWLVHAGGGLVAIEGGWELQHGRVVFRRAGGTLSSIPSSEVDLAASALITWHLNGRGEIPPRSPLPEDAPDGPTRLPCISTKVVSLVGAETLEVETSAGRETVHVACLDAPETGYRLTELGYFGRATFGALRTKIEVGGEVCLAEDTPPQRDREGHRVVYVGLPDGGDLTGYIVASGLGLLRLGSCARAAAYRKLEDRAIAEGRGLWGQSATSAALAVAQRTVAIASAEQPGSPRAGGSVRTALPARRVGGG